DGPFGFMYIFLFGIGSMGVATGQECVLSGKTVRYTTDYCLSTGCTRGYERFTIIGDKILGYDEGKGTGRIYYVGKTIDATKDPAQNTSTTLLTAPVRGAKYQVRLSASIAGNEILMKDERHFGTGDSHVQG